MMSEQKKIAVGIDIGTTTVSAIVLDGEQVVQIYNVPNDSKLEAENPWEHIQSPERIFTLVEELLGDILNTYPVSSIGVTGQMHGMLQMSHRGEALSPLYTWQDTRAKDDNNACDEISRLTPYHIPAGYGLATQYHLMNKGEVPEQPYYICTIMDYIIARLCGNSRPVIHITNAASWGFYSHTLKNFDLSALEKLGISEQTLPLLTEKKEIVGYYKSIPVAVSIGDNQAAFMGAVTKPDSTVLLNVGTGSQVSLLSEKILEETSLIEARPYDEKCVLYSGSALCGGRAYAMLEKLFRTYAVACGLPDEPRYDVLNAFAKAGLEQGAVPKIRTTFAGTRENPAVKGSMIEIEENNFTPEGFSAGVLYGMVGELFEMYEKMPHTHIKTIVASGNGVRKNPLLQQVIEAIFQLPVTLPDHTEEAAFGAAKFGREACEF